MSNLEKIAIGEMPKPVYLRKVNGVPQTEEKRWIGMKAYSLDGTIKDFLWWKNFRTEQEIVSEAGRHEVAEFMTQLNMSLKVELALGQPINIYRSKPDREYVKVIKQEPNAYGIYVEAGKRPMFNLFALTEKRKTSEQLKLENPEEYERIRNQILKYMPKLN